MAKRANPPKSPRASRRLKHDGAIDSQAALDSLKAIDRVLRMRFPRYSPDAEVLAPLGSILDQRTLNDVFEKACYEKTFESFCRSVSRTWKKYSETLEQERVEPRLVLAQIFNNHVATVLGKRGEITQQFLELCVRNISPELADQLDFTRAKSEPTVFVFGNNVSRVCDLLFTIPYKDGREIEFPLIVLMEHKSAPDKYVADQMLTSLVATINFTKRYPERFKTPDGKAIWPFVVLFYTGAKKWDDVQNLRDLFTTSLNELDQDWIFKLRFLFVSLVDKRIKVVPTIPGKKDVDPEAFDCALKNANWLEFFFDLLRKAELLANNPNATRQEWLNDASKSLSILKNAYKPGAEYGDEVLDDALSFIGLMCAKKKFETPTRDELVSMMEKEKIRVMTFKLRLLTDEEREEARNEGKREWKQAGKREGKREGKRDMLARMINMRFPTATPAFIKQALKPFSDSYADKLMSAAFSTSSLEEFQKKVQALAPAC